jgi:hypothetical protein
MHTFPGADGSRLRVIGGSGDGPLQVQTPRQVRVASDGFVLLADYGNGRVQVLTPRLDFHDFVGVGQLFAPAVICADDDDGTGRLLWCCDARRHHLRIGLPHHTTIPVWRYRNVGSGVGVTVSTAAVRDRDEVLRRPTAGPVHMPRT